MKRLDKPTKQGKDDLPNIERKLVVPFGFLLTGRLFGCLTAKTPFCCSHVSELIKPKSLVSNIRLESIGSQSLWIRDI